MLIAAAQKQSMFKQLQQQQQQQNKLKLQLQIENNRGTRESEIFDKYTIFIKNETSRIVKSGVVTGRQTVGQTQQIQIDR